MIILFLLYFCAKGLSSAEAARWNPFTTVVDYIETEASKAQNFTAEQSRRLNEYVEEQKRQMEAAIDRGYAEANEVKLTMENYFDEQKKALVDRIDGYSESAKETGKTMVDRVALYSTVEQKSDGPDLSDAVLTVPAIVARQGYRCETHTVISQGYVLNVHRIPHSKSNTVVPSKAVLLQHGVFASSADWVLTGPGKGLGFVLADAGYDVWMANVRGNRYSKEHTKHGRDSASYWNFSWDDIAYYDVPAVIDYIIDAKGPNSEIVYVGHSMGTTILFAMLALRPEYNEILSAGFALAPVVFTSAMLSPLKSLAPVAESLAYLDSLSGNYEFIPKESSFGRLSSACDVRHMDSLICKNFIFYICGSDEGQFNATLLPAVLAHLGAGTSWKTVVHFAQQINSEKFRRFDYGYFQNFYMYGTSEPPEYDLKKVTLPITLFWSKNDLLSNEEDVLELGRRLPRPPRSCPVPHPDFNHLDYLYAVDAPTLLNNKLLELLKDSYRRRDVISFNFQID